MRAKPDGAAVFDRRAVRAHRDRAAPGFAGRGDFLVREVGERLVGRLDDVKHRFARVLDLGCHGGQLEPLLRRQAAPDLLIEADLSPAMVECAAGSARLAADEEWLPFRAGSLDLVVSVLSLHWVNDLPGTLVQIRQALKPDGLLLAAMLGGETLFELRESFLRAEAGEEDGARPHVSPFPDVQTLGALLQRTGFALPVIDSDRITVTYANPEALMRDLRAMGETNATAGRARHVARRGTFRTAAACYREMFGDADGRIPATFQVLYLIGWRPHDSQQQPARRGSGTVGLAQVLSSRER
ncbi:MAG: methyltransferase domain-containing protein [Rhodospirillales bacterium]|nr:methyltransferase domain-containing protein [Rhodospirillales bacterium]